MKIKKYLYIYIIGLIAVAVASCSENDDTVEEFPDWQNRNETYFNSLYQSASAAASTEGSEWKVYRKWSLTDMTTAAADDHIVVKVLQEGTGSGCPLYTDSVRVHYRGRLIPSTSYTDGYVFDESFSGDLDTSVSQPSLFAVSGVVNGFSTALQKMHIGDRWMVYIPYNLGYGTSDNGTIPAYSTLIFDITLVAYYHPGKSVPNFRSKDTGRWIEE